VQAGLGTSTPLTAQIRIVGSRLPCTMHLVTIASDMTRTVAATATAPALAIMTPSLQLQTALALTWTSCEPSCCFVECGADYPYHLDGRTCDGSLPSLGRLQCIESRTCTAVA
jgi:hypothetical protein